MASKIIIGSSSQVGKSLVCMALLRKAKNEGKILLPFKPYSRAKEIIEHNGLYYDLKSAMLMQAAKIEPKPIYNPIIALKKGDMLDVFILGKNIGQMDNVQFEKNRDEYFKIILECLNELKGKELIIEGTGCAADLYEGEQLTNCALFDYIDAKALLIGDIDRGGVFAQLYGTLLLMEQRHRAKVEGFIINKFRGDVTLLQNGLDMIKDISGVPVEKVIYFDRDARIDKCYKSGFFDRDLFDLRLDSFCEKSV